MVEKSKSTNDPLDLLTINRGMKDQLKHMREEKIEAAKHGETPLIVETATKDPGALFSQVIEKDQQMSKMKKDLEQSQSLINKYQADITDLKSRISNMDRELNKKQSSISGQEKTMREMNTQLEELKESKKKMTNELEELKKLKSEHMQDQNIQKGMEKKLEQLSKGGDQAKEQMNQNNKKLKSYESKISKLESSMKELKSEISEKKKKIGQLEEKLSGLNKEHESIEQMKVSSSQEVKKLKEQLNDVKKNSQLEINRLKGHIQHLEEENARISRYETSLIGSFKTKLSDAQKQNSEKEEQMNKLKEEQAGYQKLLKKIEKKDMKIKNLQQSLGLMEDNLNLLRKNYRRDIVEMVDEVVLRDEIIDELETAIEETPDLIIVEEEIMMPEQPMQAPVPVELPNLSDIDFDTLEIPAMQSTPRAIEAKQTQKQETKLQTKQSDLIASINLMFIQLFSKLTEHYKMSSWSWMLPVFIAMLGPVGAFVASKLMFKSNWRAWASAFYWMIPLVNLLVWLDFAFTVRGQKASKDLSDFDHSFGLIGFLPFMPRPSLQLPRATNNKKDQ